MKNKNKTNLQHHRKLKGLSQSALSELSGVSYRTLQDYDQGHKDINKAQAVSVYKLSRILECNMTDIMELHKIDDTKDKRGKLC